MLVQLMAVLSLNANFLFEFLLLWLIKPFSKYSDNIVIVRGFLITKIIKCKSYIVVDQDRKQSCFRLRYTLS